MKKTTTFFILFIAICTKVRSQDWVWAKNFQNNDISALYNSFIDSNKNIYTVASFNSSSLNIGSLQIANSSEAPANPNVQYTDAYITKHDSEGNLIYAKHFNGSRHESITSIAYDGSSNFYITGFFNGSITLGTTTYQAENLESKSFIAKLDLDGNIVWSKQINYHGNSILKYKNGFLYLAGIHSGNTFTYDNLITPSANYTAVVDYMDKTFVAKLDLSGNAIWLKSSTYNGTANIQNSHRIGTQPRGLTIDNNGNVFVAGSFFCLSTTFGTQTINKTASTNNANFFIAKYDATGNFGWASTATTSSGSHSTINDIQTDALNNIYLVGTVYNSTANFGGGVTINFAGNTGSFLAKYNTAGTVSWVKGGKISSDAQPTTSLGSNSFEKIYIDATNNVYVSGVFYSYINFGNNYFVQNPNFTSNLFTVKFDGNGLASNYLKVADAAQSREVKILDIQGSTYYYSGKINDPSLLLGNINLQNTTSGQTFIAKRDISLGTDEFSKSTIIYPNPSTSIVNLSEFEPNTFCTLFDITGKKVKEFNLSEPYFSIEELAKGAYILQIENGKINEHIKLIKE